MFPNQFPIFSYLESGGAFRETDAKSMLINGRGSRRGSSEIEDCETFVGYFKAFHSRKAFKEFSRAFIGFPKAFSAILNPSDFIKVAKVIESFRKSSDFAQMLWKLSGKPQIPSELAFRQSSSSTNWIPLSLGVQNVLFTRGEPFFPSKIDWRSFSCFITPIYIVTRKRRNSSPAANTSVGVVGGDEIQSIYGNLINFFSSQSHSSSPVNCFGLPFLRFHPFFKQWGARTTQLRVKVKFASSAHLCNKNIIKNLSHVSVWSV